MSLLVIPLGGFFALIPGLVMSRPTPTTMYQPGSLKPIGTSATIHERGTSAGQPRSHMGHPNSVGSCEKLN
jgi:hypothetical protein